MSSFLSPETYVRLRPISMFFVSKSVSVSIEYYFEPSAGIDEKHGVLDIVFLGEFGENDRGNTFAPRWKEPDMEESVRLGIDGSVQPVALIVEMDHRVVERDVIRLFPSCGP